MIREVVVLFFLQDVLFCSMIWRIGLRCTTGTRSSALLILWLAKHAGAGFQHAWSIELDRDRMLVQRLVVGIFFKHVQRIHCDFFRFLRGHNLESALRVAEDLAGIQLGTRSRFT